MAAYSLYDHGATPTLSTADTVDSAVTLGTTIKPTTSGQITSIWVYIGNTNAGGGSSSALIYNGASWADVPQSVLRQQAFTIQASVGWQEIVLNSPLSVVGGNLYIVAVFFPAGHYVSTNSYFTVESTNGPLTALAGTSGSYDIGNGRYIYGSSPAYPQNRSGNLSNYWTDITFNSSGGGGGGGGSVSLSLSAATNTPNTGSADLLTATASGGTNYTYAWTVERGIGTFNDNTSQTPQYTPTTVGMHIISCTLSATEGSTSSALVLRVGAPNTSASSTFSTTVTDSLNAQVGGTQPATINSGGQANYQRRSLMGNRLAFGDPIVNTAGLILATDDQPGTFITKIYIQHDCVLTGIRFLKRAEAVGDYVFAVWRGSNTTPIFTKTVTFSADYHHWIQVDLDEPLSLVASDTVPYIIGFFSPDGKMFFIPNGFGSQDVLEYPFYIKYNNGGFGNVEATGYTYSSSLSYPTHWTGGNYMIDPIVEWEAEDAVYHGGTEYYHRFSATSGMNHFPIAIWQPSPEAIPQLSAIGINTVMVMAQGNFEGGMAAIVSANIDVIPEVSINDYSTLAQIEANPAFNALVRGFFIADEPDMIGPWRSPTELMAWYVELRKRDSTKMLIMNMGKRTVLNQGYAALPAGAGMKDLNTYWRQYARLSDIISCDFYMEDSRNLDGIYGLWCNPNMVKRLSDLSDRTRPVWHYLATAATPDNQPSPDLVYKSVWASLIGGARGLVFFDYTFTNNGGYVTDFSMGANPAMASMVTGLCTLIQSLKVPLLGPDIELDVSVVSSNVTEGPVGGTYGVPIHYASRTDGSKTYLFTQAIRPGTTAASFTIPAAANQTITVINESRTINVNGSGQFTDAFAADYSVHLYRWG